MWGRVRFRCWLEGGHGRLDLAEGLAQSCNSVYVELGQRLGAKMISYAKPWAWEAKQVQVFPRGTGQPL